MRSEMKTKIFPQQEDHVILPILFYLQGLIIIKVNCAILFTRGCWCGCSLAYIFCMVTSPLTKLKTHSFHTTCS